MEHALASGSKAWSSKSAETAEEWLKKFMAAAETFPACIVVSDMTQPGAPMIFVNDAFCRVTGYSKEETVGRNCRFLQGPDTEPEAVATIRSTLSKGQNCHVKITNYRKNGDRFQNLLSMKPVFDANGIYRYVIGVQFEVVADRTLKKRLGHLDKLLKSMPNKLQGKQKGASQRRSELMYLAVGASNVKQAVAAGRLSQEELDASRAAAMAESSGSLDTALNTVSNTKAWSTKNATDADDWLKAFIATADSFPACIVVSDMTQPGAPMIFVNDAFCKVTGYSKEETVGRNCRFLQGPDTEPEAIALIRSTLSQGQDCHVKLTNYRKNGEKFQNLLSMKPVFDANGIYRYVIGVQFEVVADKGLKRRLSQLDKLLTMMPSKLQTKANATSESDVDLLLVAVGGQTPEGPSAPAGAPQSTVSVTRTKSSDAAALESALNAVSRRNLWGAKTTADADTWLSKFTGTAENFPSCIVVSDMTIPGAPMVFVNKQFCMVTGYSKEETVGRNCRFLQGPDTEPEAVAVIRDKLGKGLDCHVKMTNYRKNGEKFQNLLSMKPVFDAEGVYRYVIGVQFEVVADEGLKKRLGQLERLLRLMPTRLQVKPSGVPAEALAPDAETARLMGQANLVIQSLGTLPAQA
ncbi:PAS domain-containing protein [Tribonema minus]|uniref:PAS domain-containing protein n=1 Tax=Tribonema minus TaxID=303371 RepID=A0A835YJF7_9STRA|nr:PAS domain-containing protein [Tribonema minus]